MTYAGQALLHAAIASLVIEALLRLWRVDEPGERLALRWVALLGPVVLTAGYLALVPGRSTAGFTERWALFSGAHWNELRMGGVGVASGATVILSVVGIALYLRDVVPFLAERVSREARDTGLPADHPAVVRVRESLAGLRLSRLSTSNRRCCSAPVSIGRASWFPPAPSRAWMTAS
jgi:hypothetical protein